MTSIQYATFEYTCWHLTNASGCLTRQLKNQVAWASMYNIMRSDYFFVNEEKRWHTTARGITLRAFRPVQWQWFDEKSQFQFLSPRSMWLGGAVTVSLLLLDPIRRHSSQPYFPPTCLAFEFSVCFPRHQLRLVAFPRLLVLFNLIVGLKSERVEPLRQGATHAFPFTTVSHG